MTPGNAGAIHLGQDSHKSQSLLRSNEAFPIVLHCHACFALLLAISLGIICGVTFCVPDFTCCYNHWKLVLNMLNENIYITTGFFFPTCVGFFTNKNTRAPVTRLVLKCFLSVKIVAIYVTWWCFLQSGRHVSDVSLSN